MNFLYLSYCFYYDSEENATFSIHYNKYWKFTHISQCEELKIEEQHVFLKVPKKY